MKINVRLSSKGETRSILYRISFRTYEMIEPSESYPSGKKYRQLDYSTGLSVSLKDWDNKKRFTKNDSYKNGQIANGVSRILEIGSKLSREQNLTFESLRDALNLDEELSSIFDKERVLKKQSDFMPPMEFFQSFIAKTKVTEGTRKDYQNTLNHLKGFDHYRGKVASWKGMGYDYYLDLTTYLQTIKNLKGSTIDKVIKNLKVFLSQADVQDNLEVNQDFKKTISGKSLFSKISKDEAEHVYLNETEIEQITHADMGDKRLTEIRDLFLVGCWTGLRISDLSRLEIGNINNGLLTIKTQKTRQGVVVPVTEELQRILDKYPDRLPKIPTDQHYNRELKKVCKEAGINDMIMAEVKRGTLTVIAPAPKYELITSHTARRSFATNLYRRGIPSTQLMFLTGHKTEDAFLKYIKVSKEDNARDVAKKLKKMG